MSCILPTLLCRRLFPSNGQVINATPWTFERGGSHVVDLEFSCPRGVKEALLAFRAVLRDMASARTHEKLCIFINESTWHWHCVIFTQTQVIVKFYSRMKKIPFKSFIITRLSILIENIQLPLKRQKFTKMSLWFILDQPFTFEWQVHLVQLSGESNMFVSRQVSFYDRLEGNFFVLQRRDSTKRSLGSLSSNTRNRQNGGRAISV